MWKKYFAIAKKPDILSRPAEQFPSPKPHPQSCQVRVCHSIFCVWCRLALLADSHLTTVKVKGRQPMFSPTEFPCTAWYMTTNGAPKEATLTGWTNASKLLLYSTTHTLHAAQCFESPEAAVKAEIESANAECMRLRKLLTAAEDKRCDAILLHAEISQKNNSKV